jgi:hypothetical protein
MADQTIDLDELLVQSIEERSAAAGIPVTCVRGSRYSDDNPELPPDYEKNIVQSLDVPIGIVKGPTTERMPVISSDRQLAPGERGPVVEPPPQLLDAADLKAHREAAAEGRPFMGDERLQKPGYVPGGPAGEEALLEKMRAAAGTGTPSTTPSTTKKTAEKKE